MSHGQWLRAKYSRGHGGHGGYQRQRAAWPGSRPNILAASCFFISTFIVHTIRHHYHRMNSAAQVDLAKNEAPAAQVLDSALGRAGVAPVIPVATVDGSQRSLSPENARRHLRGSSAITTPVRLVSKPAPHTTTSTNDVDETVATSIEPGNFESSNFESGAKFHSLQPQDTGFGAWSYVAAAFCMYIVVW